MIRRAFSLQPVSRFTHHLQRCRAFATVIDNGTIPVGTIRSSPDTASSPNGQVILSSTPSSNGPLGADTTVESNVISETNRLEKTLKAFWETISVADFQHPSGLNGLVITLDGHPIKTPDGHPLVVPKHKPGLAHLISQEWTVLKNLKVKPHSLPLTSLAARAIDVLDHDSLVEEGFKVSDSHREHIIESLLPYLDTDTIVIFAPTPDCDGKLRVAQERMYRDIIAEAEKFWNTSLTWMDSDEGILGNKQSEETRQKVSDWIRTLDPWKLIALERATMSAKSLIGAMNIITKAMTVSQVADAVNLEVIYQTERWGEVEDTHDVDHADIRRILGSTYIVSSDF